MFLCESFNPQLSLCQFRHQLTSWGKMFFLVSPLEPELIFLISGRNIKTRFWCGSIPYILCTSFYPNLVHLTFNFICIHFSFSFVLILIMMHRTPFVLILASTEFGNMIESIAIVVNNISLHI